MAMVSFTFSIPLEHETLVQSSYAFIIGRLVMCMCLSLPVPCEFLDFAL